MFATIDDCYQHFSGLYGSETPNRDMDWLRDQIHDRNLRYEEVTKELLGELWDLAVYAETIIEDIKCKMEPIE